MQQPNQNPPSSAMMSEGNEPEIEISELNAFQAEEDALIPTQTPPEDVEAENAFGAAVWAKGKNVNGLYSTFHSRNSWMSIVGTGWVKLAVLKDSSSEAMTVLASHARMKNSKIDYSVENGTVDQMYVW